VLEPLLDGFDFSIIELVDPVQIKRIVDVVRCDRIRELDVALADVDGLTIEPSSHTAEARCSTLGAGVTAMGATNGAGAGATGFA
jgi:hypothetical protein